MNKTPQGGDDAVSVAERIRVLCIDEAIRAYEQAGICGLCHEGRFEAAISALRMLDLDGLVRDDSQPPQATQFTA